jgi:hypothetical protein
VLRPEVVIVGVVAGRGLRAAAAPLLAASFLLVLGLLFGEELAPFVDLLALLAYFLLAFGELLEGVAVGPVLLKAGAHPLGHELAEPQPVGHALGPGVLALNC